MGSAADEIGTAAYKTVELDDHLAGDAHQFREVEGKESEQFLSYFAARGGVRLLQGGYGSGFHHCVTNQLDYQPRLLCVCGDRQVRVVEIALDGKMVNDHNAYVLDAGTSVYQWVGAKASVAEKMRVAQVTGGLRDDREAHAKVEIIVFESADAAEPFWKLLGGRPSASATAVKAGSDEDWQKATQSKKVYTVVIGKDDKATFNEYKGKCSRSALDTKTMYILDIGRQVWVWRGRGVPTQNKKHAMRYGIDYLAAFSRPNWLPVAVQKEHHESANFVEALEQA